MQRVWARWSIGIDSHSYSQWWFLPWGYTDALPTEHEAQYAAGLAAVTALEGVYGTRFSLGRSAVAYGLTSGTADDWYHGVAGIVHVACTEARDLGHYGFAVPAEQIVPASQE